MEKRPENFKIPVAQANKERVLVPYEESFALAQRLVEQYRDELVVAGNENYGKTDTSTFLDKIPEDVRNKFYGHGITRSGKFSTPADKLAAFINILDNSTLRGDYGSLAGGGQFGAWTNADLLILSHYDKHLGVPSGNIGDGKGPIQNQIGWVADIGAYVLSNKYYPILEELKRLYPDKRIIRADEIERYINQEMVDARVGQKPGI